ncbi:PTS sugar transporter subunit IIB [Microbacterium sp. 179-I 3D2 NHS]|uniref:PTS sugar transporter subunit IIB n=1 Tax=Microbacterium sp. 179-I 3D2 NHS TaxID=3235178 RepID=UPI00399F2C85
MRILVVCGAGASSTFVAQRLRRAACDAGLDWQAAAGMEHSVAASDHDLILVGPHLADRLDVIRGRAHSPVAVLPDDIFADRDGSLTLAFARAFLADLRNTPKGTS